MCVRDVRDDSTLQLLALPHDLNRGGGDRDRVRVGVRVGAQSTSGGKVFFERVKICMTTPLSSATPLSTPTEKGFPD